MLVRNVDEIYIRNWTNTGATTSVPRWTVDVEINWTKEDGTSGIHSQTYTFPNALAGIPNRRLKGYMETIILNEARIALGIDDDNP